MIMDVKADALRNVWSPMLVTPSGMVMDDNADAPWNAPYPMLLRDESGSKVIVVKLVASENA